MNIWKVIVVIMPCFSRTAEVDDDCTNNIKINMQTHSRSFGALRMIQTKKATWTTALLSCKLSTGITRSPVHTIIAVLENQLADK